MELFHDLTYYAVVSSSNTGIGTTALGYAFQRNNHTLTSNNFPEAVLNLQYSSDLGFGDPWTTVAVPETSGGPTSGVTFDITPDSPLNTITVTIPSSEASAGKLFSRLEASNP